MPFEAEQGARVAAEDPGTGRLRTRLWGLLLVLGAGAAQFLVYAVSKARVEAGGMPTRLHIGWIGLMAIALAGLLQAVTGLRFWELSARWSSLRPWQRGVGSLVVVIGAIAVAVGAVWLSVRLLSGD